MVIMDGAVVIVKDFFLYGFIGVTRFGGEVVVVKGGRLYIWGEKTSFPPTGGIYAEVLP